MAKKINYGKRFRFKDDKSEYTFQLKKRNWWWLLLLLLPLLLLIKCDCQEEKAEPVVVHVIDRDTEDDIAEATVKCKVNSILSSRPHTGVTDDFGRDTLDNVMQNESVTLTITAQADGYVDTTYTHVCIPDDMDSDGNVTIKMRPFSEDFHADIVMCIDNTGSMMSLLEMVKQNALNFHKDLKEYCAKKGQSINDIRVRVIAFGDFGDSRHTDSGLLQIPDETSQLQNFISHIGMSDGGDGPEDGLEALALAIRTPWDMKATRRRHIIIIYTDAAPHPLGTTALSPNYPPDMPRSMDELTSMWEGMDRKARRLVLFAPNDATWKRMGKKWDNVIHEKKDLSKVLSGKGYDKILEAISKSL